VPAPGEKISDIAVAATLKAAALRGGPEGGLWFSGMVLLRDLRKKVRVSRGSGLILFLVDASDSMGSSAQLAAAKGAVLALLSKAYIRRDRVGLIAFRDEEAKVLLPPASSVYPARKKLGSLSSGGATPFADGLLKARRTIGIDRLKHPGRDSVLVIVSDGEANVPLSPGGNRIAEIRGLGEAIRRMGTKIIFVDTNPPGTMKAEAGEIAAALRADYRRLSRIRSGDLIDVITKNPAGH
jgi:magnesium chelatase subunit D